jgi:hypothetical protein
MPSHRLIWTVLALFTGGCAAFAPMVVSLDPENQAQYHCGPYTVRSDLAPSPLINFSNTPLRLEVDITVHSVQPVFELAENDVRVRLPGSDALYPPIARTVTYDTQLPQKPWYFKVTRFTFDIDPSTISGYVLTFPSGLHGCVIPDIKYRKVIRPAWNSNLPGP